MCADSGRLPATPPTARSRSTTRPPWRGYEPRALTLSYDATGAFERAYRRERSPKAMAVSPVTGAFGIGKSADAAIAACRGGTAGAGECRVVIAD